MENFHKKNEGGIPRLLVLGVRGLDWHLVSEKSLNESLPHLSAYISQGISGPLHSIYPLYCESGWTAIATGRRVFHPAIGPSMQPSELPQKREVPAFWNILSQAGIFCSVVGWPGVSKAEKIRGAMILQSFFEASEPLVRVWPIPRCSVAPIGKVRQFSAFRLHPEKVPESWCGALIPLYFSEEPEMLLPMATIRSSLAVDRSKLNMAIRWARGRQSGVLGICLSGLETICSMGLSHRLPPTPRDSLLGADVFTGLVDRAYEWYDRWLHELLSILPPDTNVIILSDRGMLSHERRSGGPEDESLLYSPHGKQGCLIASGSAFERQIPLRRATLLDICPTILSLYGIRQDREMEGAVLESILFSPKYPRKTVSWGEASIGMTKRRDIHALESPELCRLGWAFLDAGQLISAISLLRVAWERVPDSLEIASALASALFLAGHRLRASAILQTALQKSRVLQATSVAWTREIGFRFGGSAAKASVPSREILAAVAQWLANPGKFSANRLFQLFRAAPDSFLLSLICGFAASSLGRWKEAKILLGRASALNGSDPESLVEISRIYLRHGMPKAAVKTARLAIEKSPLHLRGAVVLAQALLALGDVKGAAEYARRAAQSIEQRRIALLILARMSQLQGDRQKASRYRRIACRVKRKLLAIGESFPLPRPQASRSATRKDVFPAVG